MIASSIIFTQSHRQRQTRNGQGLTDRDIWTATEKKGDQGLTETERQSQTDIDQYRGRQRQMEGTRDRPIQKQTEAHGDRDIWIATDRDGQRHKDSV